MVSSISFIDATLSMLSLSLSDERYYQQVALVQIRSRLSYLEGGRTEPDFKVPCLTALTITSALFHIWTALSLFYIVDRPQLWLILICTIPLGIIDSILIIYFFYLVMSTRKEIQQTYAIRDEDTTLNSEMENALLSIACSCCTISQMGRHTADYSTYRDNCCSSTGLPRHLEVLVPTHVSLEKSRPVEV
jgi:hypothetical protein